MAARDTYEMHNSGAEARGELEALHRVLKLLLAGIPSLDMSLVYTREARAQMRKVAEEAGMLCRYFDIHEEPPVSEET